jgi:preprotein translocase subunit YajC
MYLKHPFVVAMAQPQGQQSPLAAMIPLFLIMAIFFFLVILPMRKRQSKIQAFLAALKAGDKVITSGGIYGTITKVSDDTLQLQIAQNVRIDVSRNAVVGYQGQPPVAEENK